MSAGNEPPPLATATAQPEKASSAEPKKVPPIRLLLRFSHTRVQHAHSHTPTVTVSLAQEALSEEALKEKREFRRKKITEEIITTEQSYVTGYGNELLRTPTLLHTRLPTDAFHADTASLAHRLETCVNVWQTPLQIYADKPETMVIPHTDINTLFSHLRIILSVNKKLLGDLEERVNPWLPHLKRKRVREDSVTSPPKPAAASASGNAPASASASAPASASAGPGAGAGAGSAAGSAAGESGAGAGAGAGSAKSSATGSAAADTPSAASSPSTSSSATAASSRGPDCIGDLFLKFAPFLKVGPRINLSVPVHAVSTRRA